MKQPLVKQWHNQVIPELREHLVQKLYVGYNQLTTSNSSFVLFNELFIFVFHPE